MLPLNFEASDPNQPGYAPGAFPTNQIIQCIIPSSRGMLSLNQSTIATGTSSLNIPGNSGDKQFFYEPTGFTVRSVQGTNVNVVCTPFDTNTNTSPITFSVMG